MTRIKPEVFTTVDGTGYLQFHHRNCGKVWYEAQDDLAPQFCPECGDEILRSSKEDNNDG